WSYSNLTYNETVTAPFRSFLIEENSFECSRATTCRQTLVKRSYDEYGNVRTLMDAGDISTAVDDRMIETVFYPNVAKYIVSLPAARNDRAGLTTTSLLLHRTVTAYDSQSDATLPPKVGNETQVRTWNSKDGTYITTTRTFDAFGNVLTSKDALGNTT